MICGLFCGAEHLSFEKRWEEGYLKNNRPDNESGYDLNKYIWQLKKNIGKNLFILFLLVSGWHNALRKVL